MYCIKCGATIGEGERFCSACGASVDEQPSSGQQNQPPYPGQAYVPAPPAYGQGSGEPPRKKPGKGLWIGLGAALLAVILALILFVYPGVLVGGSGGPLSGKTVQTRFVNDSAAVFTDAFSGLGDKRWRA